MCMAAAGLQTGDSQLASALSSDLSSESTVDIASDELVLLHEGYLHNDSVLKGSDGVLYDPDFLYPVGIDGEWENRSDLSEDEGLALGDHALLPCKSALPFQMQSESLLHVDDQGHVNFDGLVDDVENRVSAVRVSMTATTWTVYAGDDCDSQPPWRSWSQKFQDEGDLHWNAVPDDLIWLVVKRLRALASNHRPACFKGLLNFLKRCNETRKNVHLGIFSLAMLPHLQDEPQLHSAIQAFTQAFPVTGSCLNGLDIGDVVDRAVDQLRHLTGDTFQKMPWLAQIRWLKSVACLTIKATPMAIVTQLQSYNLIKMEYAAFQSEHDAGEMSSRIQYNESLLSKCVNTTSLHPVDWCDRKHTMRKDLPIARFMTFVREGGLCEQISRWHDTMQAGSQQLGLCSLDYKIRRRSPSNLDYKIWRRLPSEVEINLHVLGSSKTIEVFNQAFQHESGDDIGTWMDTFLQLLPQRHTFLEKTDGMF